MKRLVLYITTVLLIAGCSGSSSSGAGSNAGLYRGSLPLSAVLPGSNYWTEQWPVLFRVAPDGAITGFKDNECPTVADAFAPKGDGKYDVAIVLDCGDCSVDFFGEIWLPKGAEPRAYVSLLGSYTCIGGASGPINTFGFVPKVG